MADEKRQALLGITLTPTEKRRLEQVMLAERLRGRRNVSMSDLGREALIEKYRLDQPVDMASLLVEMSYEQDGQPTLETAG